jgi:hypothetical protein
MRKICLEAIRRHLEEDERPRALDPDPILTELWDNEDDAIYDNL